MSDERQGGAAVPEIPVSDAGELESESAGGGEGGMAARARGRNQRFVVTSMSRKDWKPKELYEKLYCARGDMENRIKEQQLHLFADRTSAGSLRANRLRMYRALFEAMLLEVIRRVALVGTELAKAQYGTMRALLLKVAGEVRVSVRRVRVRISSVFPRQELFAQCLARFREALAT